ncbi:MAG TPA: thiamine phosphate synthase [Hyphomicrobiaceae bacterium]|nr:thiamine phosphate synthase [Hyphomicrobiaceae bacterium]
MTPEQTAIGLDVFYPIVPDIDWLQRLVPLGVKTIQLRMKELPDAEVRGQISAAMAICDTHGCELIVNDFWQEAIELGARFVHLGQEDLADADLKAIRKAGVRLGVSTHNEEELEIALRAEPDYIALGPVYETKLKVMKWAPQGLDRVGQWKKRIGRLPLVAIAGITIARAPGVLEAGADSAAVITDFVTHSNPELRVREWLAWAAQAR